jgi:hypothetical protein
VPKRMPAKVEARDLAAEVIGRARATHGGDLLPYVVRLSDPPTPHERLQLAACRILRHPIAVMPVTCLTVQEWSERYSKSARS